MILIEVNGQSLFVKNPEIVEESVKYLRAAFSFSKDWKGYSKAAIFKGVEGEPKEVILEEASNLYAGDGEFFVPHEVIKSPKFYVSLVGYKDDSKITTESIGIEVKVSGASEGIEPSEPTPDAFSQISQMCTDAMEEARTLNEKAEEIKTAHSQTIESAKEAKEVAQEAVKAKNEAVASKEFCEEARAFVEEKTNENETFSANCAESAEQVSADREYCQNARIYCNSARAATERAKEATETARLTLEEGVEWIFDGGDAVGIQEITPKILHGTAILSAIPGVSSKSIGFGEETFKKAPTIVLTRRGSDISELPEISLKSFGLTNFEIEAKNEKETVITVFVNWIAIGQ